MNQKEKPDIHLQEDEPYREAACGCFLSVAGDSGDAAFTYCEAHERALDPSKIETATFVFDHAEARGEIKVTRETYGLGIHLNGKCLVFIDLFHLSPEGQSRTEEVEERVQDEYVADDRLMQVSDFPQIVIYNWDDDAGPTARVQWRNGQAVIESDQPTNQSKTAFGPIEAGRVLTVNEESEAQQDG